MKITTPTRSYGMVAMQKIIKNDSALGSYNKIRGKPNLSG